MQRWEKIRRDAKRDERRLKEIREEKKREEMGRDKKKLEWKEMG